MKPWLVLSRRELSDERPDGNAEEVRFPERLAEQVIDAFSSPGDVVLDPFGGYGTTAVVALRMGRRAISVELLADRADQIRGRVGDAATVITGDARDLRRLVDGPIDLCLTSPPYMTRTRHPENPLTGYATLDGSYPAYLDELEAVFASVASLLRPGGHLVINAATTVNMDGLTPLASDIGKRVSAFLTRRADLRLAWDETPTGLVDDRCLLFRKPARPNAPSRGRPRRPAEIGGEAPGG